MRTLLLLTILLAATPLALATPVPNPFGDHRVGPCDLWTSQYDVGDSYRLTCVEDGQTVVYAHQGSAAGHQECGYFVLGREVFDCTLPPTE